MSLLYIANSFDEEYEKRLKELSPTSSKGFRKAQETIQSELSNEFETSLTALLQEHGSQLDPSLHKELSKECFLEQTYFPPDVKVQIILCKAKLKDGTVLDPCIIHPHEGFFDILSRYSSFAAAGSVIELSKSEYMLPVEIIKKARETFEYRMTSYEPLLVSIQDEMKYLVPAFSFFYKAGDFKGKDIEANKSEAPDKAKRHDYVWAENLEPHIILS